MGGARVTPNYSTPSDVLSEALLTNSFKNGLQALQMRNDNAMWQAQHPFESYMANIPGMQKLANQEATLNAANSAILEKASNPGAYAMRQALPQALAADLAQTSGGTAGNAYKQQELANLFGTGLQNSTIGNSALFDANTIQGKALRTQAEQAAQNYLAQNQAPVAGLDPGQLVAAQQASQAGAVQNKNQFLQGVMNTAQGNTQSTSDWINNLMGNTSQSVGAHQQNWQNYQQALYNAAAQNAASQNATTGAVISAAGTIGGAALGGGFGGVLGNALAQGINSASGLNNNSNPFNASSTVENGGPASIGGYYSSPQAAYNAYSTGNSGQGSPMISPSSTPGMYTMSGWRMPGQ
jgi:hypothetical protein